MYIIIVTDINNVKSTIHDDFNPLLFNTLQEANDAVHKWQEYADKLFPGEYSYSILEIPDMMPN